MPYINIRIAKSDDVGADKKAELIKETSKVISKILNKKPESTYIIIDEVEPDSWGVGEKTLLDMRKNR